METLTINYLSHQRNQCEKYWKITSHFLNKIDQKNKVKINLLLTEDSKNFESYIDNRIKVHKYICNSYIEKIKIASESDTEFSMKLDEDVFFSNHVFDEFINIANDKNSNGIYWPLISLNTSFSDIFIKKFIDSTDTKRKVEKEFLSVKFPRKFWNQNNVYLKLNKHTLFSKKWNEDSFKKTLKTVNSVFRGIHPVRLSYNAEVLINEYIQNNFRKLFSKQEYRLIEFENIYTTSNAYMMKTKYFEQYLKYKSFDDFDEVQLNNFVNNENIKSFYLDNSYTIHTMFSTVKGRNKALRNKVTKEEAELYELNFVKNLNDYLFDEKLEDK